MLMELFMSNIYNLFKFLEKKKGTKTPFKFKLINAPDELTDEELNVEGSLDLFNTKITSLPNNLQVRGDLNLYNTPITSLPDNLKVRGYLVLLDTPLGKKYTKEEIKKIIEKKGGYVKRDIYV